MKLLLYILTLILLLGCKNTRQEQDISKIKPEMNQTRCIERIFKKDSILGRIRNHESEKITLSETIINYTSKLESLDYSNCPEKFVTSFQRHIEAWKKVVKVTDNYPSKRGELHTIFEELEKSKDSTEFKFLLKQVWDTWHKVEESAN